MSIQEKEKKYFKEQKNSKYDKPEIENDLKVITESQILIGRYEEAPDYLKDNEYIKTGYLLNINSVSKVFRSLFKCHNETMNVWSHLLGTLIAIVFIFYTFIFVSSYSETVLKYLDYEKMTYDINDVISPWIENLNKDKIEDKKIYPEIIFTYIESIIIKSNNMLNEIKNRIKDFTSYMKNYINQINSLIQKIIDKVQLQSNSKISDDITLKWEICSNKIIDILKGQNEETINNYDKTLRRWPLFIMLVAAIICLSCSTTFHLFGTMSNSINKVLSRVDYAGITFLVAGSCYPPYFYFFYCEKCKFIFN